MKVFKFLFVFFLINIIWFSCCFADDIDEDFTDNLDVITSNGSTEEPKIYSKRAIVFERNSKVVLYDKNINEKCKMASTTKIMTAILILENGNLDDIVTVSKKAALTGGSRLGLREGDKVSVRNLLYGLMLCSGNDSAVALAEYLGGTVINFANRMNEKVAELGLNSTHFVTPNGLDDDNHYTTAYELALITDYALENENFKKIVGTKSCIISINGQPKQISNTNELLGNLDGVYGVKTGFTNGAGRCLVTATNRNNGLDIITIVLGADTKKIRTSDSSKLINYCFENYTLVDLEPIILEKFSIFNNYFLPNIVVNKADISR